MTFERIELSCDYLIASPKPVEGEGFYHSFSERSFLVDNIINFLKNYPDVNVHQITIYELKEINE